MILFDTWQSAGRILLTAILFYPFIILSIDLAGKRSSAKLNGFDWIVTVAIGSIAGSTILLRDIAVFDGIIAVSALLALQYGLNKVALHSGSFAKVVRSQPTILMLDGVLRKDVMTTERILHEDVEAAARGAGFADLSEVATCVLEADSSISVIGKSAKGTGLIDPLK